MPQKAAKPGWSPLDKLLTRWNSRPLPETFEAQPLFAAVPIVMVDDVLTPAECADAIAFAEAMPFEEVQHDATSEIAYRHNGRAQLTSDAFAAVLWERIGAYATSQWPSACGCNSNIRLYRYGVGQRFGQHVDESDYDPETGKSSQFTVLIYLNDEVDSDLQGGHTLFFKPKKRKGLQLVVDVAPRTGAALLHGHGDSCLPHEGAVVTKGVKYLLRTDIMCEDEY